MLGLWSWTSPQAVIPTLWYKWHTVQHRPSPGTNGINMLTSSNGNISVLLALYAGNSPVTRPVTRSFDVLFDLRLIKRLSKQSWDWWFETPSRLLWRHFNEAAEVTPHFTMILLLKTDFVLNLFAVIVILMITTMLTEIKLDHGL